MTTSTTTLVGTLISQLNRFKELSLPLGEEFEHSDLKFSVSLSYTFITYLIDRSDTVYFKYSIQDADVTRVGCYFHDKQKLEALKQHFASLINKPGSEQDPETTAFLLPIQKYLRIAEAIASTSQYCAKGDSYSPGYFSEIVVSEDGITLKQINHMNSRSLDHKENYSLRDLEFYIPVFPSDRKKLRIDTELIGIMEIRFSDRSSKNNRVCGDRIRRKIEEEKEKAHTEE